MTMYLIDTDILVLEILSKYKYSEETKKVLTFYRKIPLMRRIITDFILAEFELYLIHAFPQRHLLSAVEKNQLHDIVIAYLRQIQNNCTLYVPSLQIMKTAFSLYQQYKTPNISNHISFSDSLLLSTAMHLQYTLISLDKTLNEYASELNIPHYNLK